MTTYPGQNLTQDAPGPIVHHPMGLPITVSCDTAWNQTRVCSDASSTEMMKCLLLLQHSGAKQVCQACSIIETLKKETFVLLWGIVCRLMSKKNYLYVEKVKGSENFLNALYISRQ